MSYPPLLTSGSLTGVLPPLLAMGGAVESVPVHFETKETDP